MRNPVDFIHDNADLLRSERKRNDELGQLSEKTVSLLRESGGMKLLQAKSHGGDEADPRDFFAWVRAVASYNPSAGWVAGVVGVHPYEVALASERLQDEIYGTTADTWVVALRPYGSGRP